MRLPGFKRVLIVVFCVIVAATAAVAFELAFLLLPLLLAIESIRSAGHLLRVVDGCRHCVTSLRMMMDTARLKNLFRKSSAYVVFIFCDAVLSSSFTNFIARLFGFCIVRLDVTIYV